MNKLLREKIGIKGFKRMGLSYIEIRDKIRKFHNRDYRPIRSIKTTPIVNDKVVPIPKKSKKWIIFWVVIIVLLVVLSVLCFAKFAGSVKLISKMPVPAILSCASTQAPLPAGIK